MADVMAPLSGDEADVEEENEREGNETDGKKKNMAGMLDVINKILNKKIQDNGQAVILSKYKEGKKRKLEQEKEALAKKTKLQIKTTFREKNHVVPDRSNAEKEVTLRRIGTKGVVKLFNAVTKHQKEMESKLKKAPTEVKKGKVLDGMTKSSFLDMLRSNPASKTKEVESKESKDEKEEKEPPSWGILRDDFMMGSKMKDWDRENDDAGDDDQDAPVDESSDESEDNEHSE